uniref:Uncharacterized protein n=1 Tax=Rhizochromulina marina TaxID=1034831 RepID=A0A7S2SQU8_9STRA
MVSRRPRPAEGMSGSSLGSEVAVASAVGAASLAAYLVLASKRTTAPKAHHRSGGAGADAEEKSEGLLAAPVHNLQRQAAIAIGGAVDHYGDVIFLSNSDFDLDTTIFASVGSPLTRMVLRAKLGNELFWRDGAARKIEGAFREVLPRPPPCESDLLAFMENECDFKCEHADGSFMDHLYFCRDYGAVHLSDYSPRVLFLHSILGVGTNLFPMAVEKLPKLANMLTEFELRHVEAFPSFLRLLYDDHVLAELRSRDQSKLKSVEFHRVIDNKLLTLDAEDVWIQLNYQLVHLIDFLPAANWTVQLDDPLFLAFIELHATLKQAGQIRAKIDFSLPNPGEKQQDGTPLTLGGLMAKVIPKPLKKKMGANMIRRYSKLAGHDLGVKVNWVE